MSRFYRSLVCVYSPADPVTLVWLIDKTEDDKSTKFCIGKKSLAAVTEVDINGTHQVSIDIRGQIATGALDAVQRQHKLAKCTWVRRFI